MHRMRSKLFAEFQQTKILFRVQSQGTPKTEKRERKKTPNRQLGVQERPVYKGVLEPNRGT